MRNLIFMRAAVIVFIFMILLLPGLAFAQTAGLAVYNYVTADGLSGGNPVCVSIDPANWVWVGCASYEGKDDGGLTVVFPTRIMISYNANDGLAGNNVFDILFDKVNDCIWFATSGGLSCRDARTGKWQKFDTSNTLMTENRCNVIFQMPDGALLVGTHGSGIYRLTLESGVKKVEEFKCPFQHVTGILIDGKNRLWVSSWEGVGYKDGDVWVPYTTDNSTLSTNMVESIIEVSGGRIIGATQKGAVVFDGITWTTFDTSNSPLPVDQVTKVEKAGNKKIWVCTWGGGVARLNDDFTNPEIFSRKNCDIIDNRITDIAVDNNGNPWVGTARGISHLMLNPVSATPDRITSVSLNAYSWENRSSEGSKVTIQANLARERYGDVSWAWSAFIADSGYDKIEPEVKIENDLVGNSVLNVTGAFPSADFIQICLTEGIVSRNPIISNDKVFPFPDKFAPEVQMYLKQAKFIPSGNEKVASAARSLVKNSSKGDMLLTACDIIYSKFFADMPYDYETYQDPEDKGIAGTDPRTAVCRSALDVLKDNLGDDRAKNRLACAMLRSVGVPARMIADNSGKYWGEAYIEGSGWIPFDVTMPVYTFGKGIERRLSFPLVTDESKMCVTGVSGSDDDLKPLFWQPDVQGYFHFGEKCLNAVRAIDKLKTAQFILVRPADSDAVPQEAKIPISKTVSMVLINESNGPGFRFYDEKNRIMKKDVIPAMNKTYTTGVEGRVSMTILPVKVGEFIMLRIFEWKIVD